MKPSNIFELPEMHDRSQVFNNRAHAGEMLADMLSALNAQRAIVFAIPAGGVPVAVPIAARLDTPLDVAVVSKITLPWNTEAGYGAVAFDGTVRINEELVRRQKLTPEDIRQGIEKTQRKVQHRVKIFRGERPFPSLKKRAVILVDDGLASGFTLLTAVEALRNAGADKLLVAVPTAHENSLERVAPMVEGLYCANVRGGWSFAVADAYKSWSDVDEKEARRLLAGHAEG
ncbi:MAG TPA: phosphoribosyltransferase [Geoalkalibacter subterraneus]|uniref:Phosphoribosyltransferase n=1 Tax=Geoalkalibacter subterraneus TaxID=483547 RepID=A0A831LRP9_9BACT|nr:phosphoribosyltransferase [Geoalkalibacter subterraneus]